MSIPRFSVRNPVFVNMMMLVILFGGAIFAFTLTKEMFPESRPDKLAISVIYPGVQPAEIEKAVTIKIEEAVRGIDGIEKVDSTVNEGRSSTILTLFNEVDDVDTVLQEVKNEVDALQDLPDDVEQVSIKKLEPRLPVISVAIFGEGSEADRKRAARRLRDELLLLPGVTDVEVTGTQEDEISVEVRPGDLRRFNVTFEELAQAIRETNLDVSGGLLKGARSRVSVRTLGEQLRARDLRDVVVKHRPDGSKVYLHQVADLRDTFVESDLESYFNGKPSVSCTVYKSSNEDAIQIATVVRAYVAGKQNAEFDPYGFNAAYAQAWYKKPFSFIGAGFSKAVGTLSATLAGHPDSVEVYRRSRNAPFDHNFRVELHSNMARFIEGRLDLMTRNGQSGLVLVIISLMLFLNWRVAFWASIGLLVSFLGAFIVMWVLGASINLLTMFGLIIVLGIIVDDAIVIGENIYRHAEDGEPPMQAAVTGAEEVMWPVTIAILTTIAAFAPLFYVRGQIGDFMGQLPIVVLAALSVSLVEALLILPAHLAHLPQKGISRSNNTPPGQKPSEAPWHSDTPSGERSSNGWLARRLKRLRRWQQRFVRGRLTGAYERFLRVALRWRYVTLATAVTLLLMAGGMVAGEVVEFVFIQKMDSESLICSLEMPVGSTSEQVRRRLKKLSALATEMPEVSNVQAFVARQYDLTGAGVTGQQNQSHLGQLVIELKPADVREREGERSSMQLLSVFREASARLAGVNSVTWEAMTGGPGGKDIHIKFSGAEFDELVRVAEEVKSELRSLQGVYDLDDDIDEGQREIQLSLKPGAREKGISVSALGNYVRSAIYGREARRITRNREDVKIMVRYPRRFRQDVHHVESMWVPVHRGSEGLWEWAPLSRLAMLKEAESYSSLHRSQQTRSVSVLGEVDQEAGATTHEILAKIRTIFHEDIQEKHPDVNIEFLGQAEEMSKSFGSLKVAFPVAMLMIYMLLAGLFRSYLQPMVVMSAVPFGFLGAVVGHWVTGNPMTILSLIGMVALTGIVVNDSLVLVDFINTRIRRGMGVFEANVQGAKLRLRAILLTTLTTVAGLTPLMFEKSFQAKFLIPMAVTLTWGLAFATLLTLVLVPTLNMIFFDLRGWFKAPAVGAPKDPFETLPGDASATEPTESEQDRPEDRRDDGDVAVEQPADVEEEHPQPALGG